MTERAIFTIVFIKAGCMISYKQGEGWGGGGGGVRGEGLGILRGVYPVFCFPISMEGIICNIEENLLSSL